MSSTIASPRRLYEVGKQYARAPPDAEKGTPYPERACTGPRRKSYMAAWPDYSGFPLIVRHK